MERPLKSIFLSCSLSFLLAAVVLASATGCASAFFGPDWPATPNYIDTVIVSENERTGEKFLANGMVLDQRIEYFQYTNQVGVGDRVRLHFDSTNYLRRVYRLPPY